jgi:hypothetical protein
MTPVDPSLARIAQMLSPTQEKTLVWLGSPPSHLNLGSSRSLLENDAPRERFVQALCKKGLCFRIDVARYALTPRGRGVRDILLLWMV